MAGETIARAAQPGHPVPRARVVSVRHRVTDLPELMDAPDCDDALLTATYRQFPVVNRLVSAWRTVYVRRIRPLLDARRTTTLLDVGFGGGDIPLALAAWARRDGLALEITAIDPDARAHAYVHTLPAVPNVVFRRALSSELVAEGARFDVVTSNHVLHHLGPGELAGLLADSEALATRLVVHSDIRRAPLAYGAYALATLPISQRSFIHHDGSLSVRRSYTAPELRAVTPAGWSVERQFPYRLLLVRETGRGADSTTR